MAGKKTKFTKKTRKSTKKRTERDPSSVSGENHPMKWPIPNASRVVFRYNDWLKLTSTTGSIASAQWRMNSLYDPDYSYTGHQPYGYDQLSGMYAAYIVTKFTIRIRYTAVTNPMRIVIEPRFNNAALGTDMQAIMERNKTLNWISVPNETGYKTFTCYLPSLAGQSLVNYKQTCGAIPTANPAVVSYLSLYAQTMDTSVTGSILFDYELYFDSLLEQPVVQAQS